MAHGQQHIYVRRGKIAAKTLKKPATKFDNLVMAISVVYPLSAVPQAIEVYAGAQGVSLYTWLTFMFVAVIFFAYGIKHRVAPMVVTNGLWFVMDLIVVIGILIK